MSQFPSFESTRRPRLGRTILLSLVVLLTLTACSGFTSKVSRRFGGKVSLAVEIDSRLNQDFPLAVDFGVVYDKDLFTELRKLTAEDWFGSRAREQYRLDNDPERLEIHSFELVPACPGCPPPGGEVVKGRPAARNAVFTPDYFGPGLHRIVVDFRLGARGAVVFSNYFNPGVHRIVVDPLQTFTLKLGETAATDGAPPERSQIRSGRRKAEKAEKNAKKAAKQAKKATRKAKKQAKRDARKAEKVAKKKKEESSS